MRRKALYPTVQAVQRHMRVAVRDVEQRQLRFIASYHGSFIDILIILSTLVNYITSQKDKR